MTVHDLVVEMKLLERRMTLYEEKYGVLSEDFYTALTAGRLDSSTFSLKRSSAVRSPGGMVKGCSSIVKSLCVRVAR